MMKIAIIGSNIEAAKFINDAEIVDNYAEANIIVFAGDINYRSATTKFNRITADKLVIAIGSACEFLAKRLTCDQMPVNSPKNSTAPMYCDNEQLIYEVLCDSDNTIVPKGDDAIFIHGRMDYGYFKFKNRITNEQADFIRRNSVPIIMQVKRANKPQCLFVQINANYINHTSYIGKFLNRIICSYKHFL